MKANVNIWSIEKDNSIKVLLLLLTEALGGHNFNISENCHLDPRSVRLYNIDDYLVSVYIYTYGQSNERYGIHLEFPTFDESDISSSMDIYENIKFEELVELLRTHLEITDDKSPDLPTY